MLNLSSLHMLALCFALVLFCVAVRETLMWFFMDWKPADWEALKPVAGRPLPRGFWLHFPLCVGGVAVVKCLPYAVAFLCASAVLNILRVLGALWI